MFAFHKLIQCNALIISICSIPLALISLSACDQINSRTTMQPKLQALHIMNSLQGNTKPINPIVTTPMSTPNNSTSQHIPTPPPTSTNKQTGGSLTYTDAGYTIKYPQNWSVSHARNHFITTDPSGHHGITIFSLDNPNGTVQVESILKSDVKLFEQKLSNATEVPGTTTATFAGTSWLEQSFTGTFQGMNISYTVLLTNHPTNAPNTRAYEIIYYSPSSDIAQTKGAFFNPMLQSLTFTS